MRLLLRNTSAPLRDAFRVDSSVRFRLYRLVELASLSPDQKQTIRVYLYQARFSDAMDVYCSAGADRDEADMIVPLIYRDLKAEPGFRAKAIFFGIMKSLSVAVTFAPKWAIVGSLWAWAIGIPIMTAAIWTFGVTFLVGMLLGQTLFRKEHALALGMISTTLAMWVGAAAIIGRIVRWFLGL